MTKKLIQHLWHKGYPFLDYGFKIFQVFYLTEYLTLYFIECVHSNTLRLANLEEMNYHHDDLGKGAGREKGDK